MNDVLLMFLIMLILLVIIAISLILLLIFVPRFRVGVFALWYEHLETFLIKQFGQEQGSTSHDHHHDEEVGGGDYQLLLPPTTDEDKDGEEEQEKIFSMQTLLLQEHGNTTIMIKILGYLGLKESIAFMGTCKSNQSLVLNSKELFEQHCLACFPHLLNHNNHAKIQFFNNKDQAMKNRNNYNHLALAAKTTTALTRLPNHALLANSKLFEFLLEEDLHKNGFLYTGTYPRYFSLCVKTALPKPSMPNKDNIFVSPYCCNNSSVNDNDNTMVLTPRSLSYYEITLHQQRQEQQQSISYGNLNGNSHYDDQDNGGLLASSNSSGSMRQLPPSSRSRRRLFMLDTDGSGASSPLCEVSIGLAKQSYMTREFQTSILEGHGDPGYFPGWDQHSYGYHGKDGALYFKNSKGFQIHKFPAFGPGDTVGCGVDYKQRAIFFTRNGRFLGRVWNLAPREEEEEESFYPIVGAVPGYPISFNFGYDKPFMFDPATELELESSSATASLLSLNVEQNGTNTTDELDTLVV